MLFGFFIIIGFAFLGDMISQGFGIVIPGPVIGMILLFSMLMIRKSIPQALDEAGQGILKYIGLLFVPAGAGISLYLELLVEKWDVILLASVTSTILTLGIAAWLFQTFAEAEDESGF